MVQYAKPNRKPNTPDSNMPAERKIRILMRSPSKPLDVSIHCPSLVCLYERRMTRVDLKLIVVGFTTYIMYIPKA